jgi:hypothetical protein
MQPDFTFRRLNVKRGFAPIHATNGFLYEIGQPVKALPRSVWGKRRAAHHAAESRAKDRAKR